MAHKSPDLKLTAVFFFFQCRSYSLTAQTFFCSRRSLSRWVAQYLHSGNVNRKLSSRVAYKVYQDHVNFIIDYLQHHKTASTPEILVSLKERFPDVDLSVRHLYRVIRQNNFTRKRTRHGHFPKTRYKKPINRNKELERFFSVIKKFPLDHIISIDETSITPFMFRKYSRCPLGERCIESTDDNMVFTKKTFVGAITSKRILEWQLYEEGAMTTERFGAFLHKIILNHNIKDYLFVFDNAGAHKNDRVRRLIESSGNHLLYCVPYNPQTSAIENFFSQFKYYLETSKTRNFEERKEDILDIIENKITEEHYHNYFRYAYDLSSYKKGIEKRPSTRVIPPRLYKT